jgi:hypothetical protein
LSTTLSPTYIAAIPEADSNRYYVRKNTAGTSIEVSHPRDNIWNIGGTPSLDLNFAKNKSLIDGVSGNNLISFARNSTATYVGEDGLIKTAAANEARFDHNPVTGESLGLLIEEQRTNLLLRSAEFDNVSWGKNNATITANSIAAPDDTLTADKLSATLNNSFALATHTVTINAANPYTVTVFAKAGEFSWLLLKQDSGSAPGSAYRSAWFNLSTGVIGTVESGLTASIQAFPNGWYRCSITYQLNGSGTSTVSPHIASTDGSNLVSGANGSKGIYIWGAQLEAGAFPTSYIPTTTAAVTRSADVASITGANFSSWYNQSAGTIFMDYKRSLYVGNAYPSPWVIRDSVPGAYLNGIQVYAEAGNSYDRLSGTNIGTTPAVTLSNPLGRTDKNVATFTSGSLNMAINGTLGTQSSSNIYASGSVNRFEIGTGFTFKRLTYWPSRLPNQTLQTITQ